MATNVILPGRETKNEPACKLVPTLETWFGMVKNQGAPTERDPLPIPEELRNAPPMQLEDAPDAGEAFADHFASCVVERRLPAGFAKNVRDVNILQGNVHACCTPDTGVEFMKKIIRSRQRLDLEQAAAVVISSITNDEKINDSETMVRQLVQNLDSTMLMKSCMWIDSLADKDTVKEQKFNRYRNGIQKVIVAKDPTEADKFSDWADIMKVLMRVRRHNRPRRCLYLPPWVFDAANIKAPEHFRASWGTSGPGIYPELPECEQDGDGIIFSHNQFNYFQRRLFRFYRFWDPEIRLRKAVDSLQEDVKYSTDYIRNRLRDTDETLLVAHYFFALQRRMQLKVVSNNAWTAFLPKGGSSEIFQNNTSIISAFEEKLSEFSGQTGIPIAGDIGRFLQKCCLLMEEYVAVYAKGDRTKLVFVRDVRGGSGRGAVDTYNLLCDLLRLICKDERSEGLNKPGKVHKFLAKDIMAWNNSFADDAFANGKVPGWEPWLAERRAELEGFSKRPF